MNKNRIQNLFVFIFLWGCILSSTQTILLREYLCFAGGNELSFGLLLSIWLLFNAIGAFLSGFYEKEDNNRVLYLFPFFSLLLTLASILFLRYERIIFSLEAGVLADVRIMFIMSLIAVFMPALISGLSFPYFSNILRHKKGDLSIAYVYGIESLGLLLGYLFTLIMLKFKLTHLPIIGLTNGLLIVYLFLNKKDKFFLSMVGYVLFLCIIITLLNSAEKFTQRDSFERANSGYTFIRSIETNYNRYIVAERNSQYVLFVNNMFSRLIGDEYVGKLTGHLIMSLTEKKDRVLVVGEASYDLLIHMLEHSGKIDYIEYDSNLSKFVQLYSPVKVIGVDGINFIEDDGRKYIRESKNRYDIVFIDLPEPLSLQMNRYYTSEFFSEVKNIVNERGIFVTRFIDITSATLGQRLSYITSVYNALKRQFPYVMVMEYGYTIFVASHNPVEMNIEKVIKRYMIDDIKNCDFEPEIFSLLLQVENNNRVERMLQSGGIHINSDRFPRAMHFGLISYEMSLADKKDADAILSPVFEYGLYVFLSSAL